jgi:crotonobetainyl-CoA:carnitine CoA-transferase CaiB-like acyl-CoA transferase
MTSSTKKSNWKYSNFKTKNVGTLKGIRVLDLSRVVAGNMTSLQLADFGAEVIKVEPLPDGDPLRTWKQGGESTFWKVYSRNKKSIGVDFRSPDFTEIIGHLIKKSDVMIENFRPGTLEKMGFGFDRLKKINPKLILLRISGFGQTGTYTSRPGFGTLVESMSGFAHKNGELNGGPLLPPLALADMISGLYGSSAILMALRARDTSGEGQIIDLSLLDAMVSVLGPEALDYKLVGKPKQRIGNQSNTSAPRNVYETKDGHFLSISASTPKMAARLFESIGHGKMNEDQRFNTNEGRLKHRDIVDQTVAKWIAERNRNEILKTLVEADVTIAPLYSIADIISDPHFVEREVYSEIPDDDLGTIPVHKPVPSLSDTPATFRNAAPEIGQDTTEVLLAAGFKEEEIHQFFKRKSIK